MYPGRTLPLDRSVPSGSPPLEMLGVRFDLVNTPELLDAVEAAVRSGERTVIGGHNVHSVYLYHRHAGMRSFYARSRVTFLDGMPLVWMARALGFPARREHRHAPIDWMPLLLQRAAERGWRVFFLGSEPAVAEQAERALRARFPALQLQTHHGYFDATPGSAGNEAVLARLQEFQPQLLAVCMGMPRQEQWIVDNLERLPRSVVFDLGALMDLFAGVLPVPPRWIGQVGMEWLYRLCSHPRRVWHRYLVEPWFLVPLAARDLLRGGAGRGRPREP